MFITTLTIIYAVLALSLIVVYISNQRLSIVLWAEKKGLKNNFFIRTLRRKPRTKSDKTHISKIYT